MAEHKGSLASAAVVHVVLWRSLESAQVQELQLQLNAQATIADALAAAGWPLSGSCGVWGRVVSSDHVLRDGDRVELYRPLTVDPKKARRERFQRQGARATGLFAKRRPNSKAGY